MALLSAEGQLPKQIQRALAREGFLNPATHQPYSLSTVKADLKQKSVIAELIGRVQAVDTTLWSSLNSVSTLDAYRPDYRLWDEFRNCRITEYKFSGLFADPINQTIAYYTLGNEPIYKLSDAEEIADSKRYYTDQQLKVWTKGHLSQLQKMVEDRCGLGDAFVIVNPDASISIPSPNTVEVFRSIDDPNQIVQIIVRNRYQTNVFEDGKRKPVSVNTEDIYNAQVHVRRTSIGQQTVETIYDNIFGRIPLVHFPNNRRGNELYGRVEYEALLPLFAEYNDVFVRGAQGVKLMGNPILAFQGLDNVQATVDSIKSSLDTEWEDDEYSTQTRDTVDVTAGTSLFVPKGTADFIHPAIGFTADWRSFLKLCFLLICDNRRIPEYQWGAAVEASKASTETQESPFITYIEGKRMELDGVSEVGDAQATQQGMLDLMQLVLIALRFTDPKIHVGKVKSRYQPLAKEDAQIRLQKAIYVDSKSYAPPQEIMSWLDMSDDPAKSVEEGQKWLKKKIELEAQMQDDFMKQINTVANRETDPTRNENAPQSAGGGENNG